MDGKGGGARGIYQGKATNLSGRASALEILNQAKSAPEN